jgi:putative ABC transport system ATP-binding protein
MLAVAPVVEASKTNLHLKSGGQPLHILRDVSLTLARGEVAAIVGPSGSGKTSLLMVLSGLERASSGSIKVDGTEISGMSEDQLANFRRKTLGILFQNFHLIPSMTALENVALTLEIAEAGKPWKEIRDRAAAALAEVGLSERLTHLPNALSGLLADEPTGNLDQETGERVIEMMFGLARNRGTSILLITHDPELAHRADRLLHMNQGRLTVDAAVPA